MYDKMNFSGSPSDSSNESEVNKINTDQTELILEKQFQSHHKIQDNLFKTIRFIGIGVTGIAGIISFLISSNIQLTTINQNISSNIAEYSTSLSQTTAGLLVIIPVFISFIIATIIGISVASDFVKIMYSVLSGLDSPTLEPVESKCELKSHSKSHKNSEIAKWIEQNHSTISESSNSLDTIYETILLVSFKLLLLLFVILSIYSSDPRFAIAVFGALLMLLWPYRDRNNGQLLNKNINYYLRGSKLIKRLTFAFGSILLMTGIYIDIIIRVYAILSEIV